MVYKNESVESPMRPTMIHQNGNTISPSTKFDNNNDEEATNIPRPQRSHKSLSQEQSILLLKFLTGTSSPETDIGTFKAYCSIHSEQLGEQGSITRRFIQNHYSNWKKQGKLPLSLGNPFIYPVEFVQPASRILSKIVQEKQSMIAQEKEGPQKLTQHPHKKEYLKYQIKLSN